MNDNYERRGQFVTDLYRISGKRFVENYRRFAGDTDGTVSIHDYIELLKADAIIQLAALVGDAGEDFADHFVCGVQHLLGGIPVSVHIDDEISVSVRNEDD